MYHKSLRNWLYATMLLSAITVPQMISTVSEAAEAPREKHAHFKDADKGDRLVDIIVYLPPESSRLGCVNYSGCIHITVIQIPDESEALLDARVKQADQVAKALGRLIKAMLAAGASYKEIDAVIYVRLDALKEKDAALRASHKV